MKKKQLTRHILMALAMSAAMGTTGMAADKTFTEFVGDTEKGGTINVSEDTTVNSDYTTGYAPDKIGIGPYNIQVTKGNTLTLNDLIMYNPHISGEGDIVINVTGNTQKYSEVYTGGIVGTTNADYSNASIQGHNLTITNERTGWYGNGIFVGEGQKSDIQVDLTGKLQIQAGYNGITTENSTSSKINISADEVEINGKSSWGIFINGSSSLEMTTVNDMQIHGAEGISNNSTEKLTFTAEKGAVKVDADTLYGVTAGSGDIALQGNSTQIRVDENSSYTGYVVRSENGNVNITASKEDNVLIGGNKTTGIYSRTNSKAGVELNAARDNIITAALDGAYSKTGAISLSANRNNQIQVGAVGLKADGQDADQSVVTAEAGAANLIEAGNTKSIDYDGQEVMFGDSHAAYAENGGDIFIKAGEANVLSGAVYANGTGAVVKMSGLDGAEANVTNAVYSAAVIANAGNLNTDKSFAGKSVISALYAEDGANISVSGTQNVFRTYADNTNENQLERVLWAYDGADITVDGATFISTDRYSSSPNSADIAIAAGTAVGLDEATVNAPVTDRATVMLNYDGNSSITGDILAAYAGQVDIAAKAGSGAGISVTGNILSGNNGVLNLDLGKGGTLTGRADDYGDAGIVDNSGHGTEFFNPAFSSSIYKGGEVNLTMGEGSRWNVTGQSWITRINTETAASADSVFAAENPVEALQHMATIDLTSEFSDLEKGGHALTVYDMKGDAAFNMKLHADRSVSDMLYMKHAEGNYIINVVDAVNLADMYAEGFDGLRFATVGAGSNANFRAVTVGQGVFNVEYEVGTDDYATSTENSAYNGESLSEKKPGDSMVDNFFGSEGTPGVNETGNEGIQTMALYAEETPDETVSNDASEPEGPTNYKLIGRADEQTSNAGQTIIDMSRVNYSNAVYMDRLNKRMGEARYIEGDDGLWVRLRHDRIGKDDAFRSMNTMFELGYDWHAKGQKDGEHRQGVAFDYMRGTADYKNVAGDGDVRRAGVWLYDTWMGDKGHYSDYVVKYGRLSNDFDIYSELGEKISGDYDNDVWSVSAEYGRKKDIGNDWYFEPQAQMQYAYVTSADYTTSQGTKVELDGIDSLIGRAGFRLGRDTSEGNTVYFKADILHEFLGDQSIRAMDATGTLSTTYENEGTWYDVGFGFAHKMGKDSYVFLDVEHSFGNDNDDTYQINIGLNHAF